MQSTSERAEGKLIVGVVQLSSQDDVAANVARACGWIERAADAGAGLVVLPENFAFMGEDALNATHAEEVTSEPPGPITRALRDVARRRGVYVVAGGMPERTADPRRPYNLSLLVGPDGAIVARYRKVHLFDVDLPDGTSHKESARFTAGEGAVVAPALGTQVGMAICYDLRFPELFRRLVDAGARIVTLPAAFTLTTGKDHWHTLLRARAIENQVYVVAAAQTGKHPGGKQTYGKSLIVDPWGDVIAQCGEGEGFTVARIDLAYQDRVRAALPCLLHRKL